jgi:hypothetical protein
MRRALYLLCFLLKELLCSLNNLAMLKISKLAAARPNLMHFGIKFYLTYQWLSTESLTSLSLMIRYSFSENYSAATERERNRDLLKDHQSPHLCKGSIFAQRQMQPFS